MATRDSISRARAPAKRCCTSPCRRGQAFLVVERELALRLAERRMQAGTTFAKMVRAGDPDLTPLVLAHIAELRAEHQAIDLDLARLAPAATLKPMATRRDPDIIVLDRTASSASPLEAPAPATGSLPTSRLASGMA